MMGDVKKVLVIHPRCSPVSEQREVRHAKSEPFIQAQYGKLFSKGSHTLAWDPLAKALFLCPPPSSCDPQSEETGNQDPENCAWRSGIKMMLSHLSCKRKAKAGAAMSGEGKTGQTRLSCPHHHVPSFPPYQSTIPTLGRARGADILGKLDGL